MNQTSRDSLLTRGLALLESLDPVTVTLSGTDYAGSAGPITRDTVFTEGGEIQVRRRVVQLRRTVLATSPSQGDLATISGESWRVMQVVADQRGLMWKLHLEGPSTP